MISARLAPGVERRFRMNVPLNRPKQTARLAIAQPGGSQTQRCGDHAQEGQRPPPAMFPMLAIRRILEQGLAGESKSPGPPPLQPPRGKRASGLLWAARRPPERFSDAN